MKPKRALPTNDEPPDLGNTTMVLMSNTTTPAASKVARAGALMDFMRAHSDDEALMNRVLSELAAYGVFLVAASRASGYHVVENAARGYGAWLYPFGKRSEDGRHPPSSLRPERGAPGVTFLAENVSLIKAVHVAHSAVLRRIKWPGESRPRAYRQMPYAEPVYDGRSRKAQTTARTGDDTLQDFPQDPLDAPI